MDHFTHYRIEALERRLMGRIFALTKTYSTLHHEHNKLAKRVADAEAEANNAMVQSLENEKTILSLRLEVQELRDRLEASEVSRVTTVSDRATPRDN